jgi:hypothetical protein
VKVDPRTLARPFDGTQLVARHAPGTATGHQKRQAARINQLGQALRDWADRFSLPHRHIDRAAYYTVVSTPLELPLEQLTALAETIFWIYVLDDFLDQRSATPETLLQLDRDLCPITAALSLDLYVRSGRAGRRPHPAMTSSLLEELYSVVTSSRLRGCDGDRERVALREGIREALSSLLAHLEGCWRDLSTRAEIHRFRHCLVRRQIARCMASMRREFEWNVRLAGRQDLPSFNTYLMTGSVSIGMHAVAAVVASYERDAARAWQRSWAGIDTAGRIIRLANDLATYPRELAEGKMSAISLIPDQPGRSGIGEAADVVRQSLHELTKFFGYVCPPPTEWTVLPFYLHHIVGFALAAYRQEEETASAALTGERGRDDEEGGD